MSTTLKDGAASRQGATGSGFICGPVADSILIIGAPLVALIIACPLFSLDRSVFDVSLQSTEIDVRQFFIVAFIQAHLFLVYFRSHANPNIFRLYPLRFTVVPLVLFVAGSLSSVMLGVLGVVAIWWDVYHSSLQTFGFGRIYDSKRKNDATVGRSLDYWMNLFVYLGPVLAGAHFIDHLEACKKELRLRGVEDFAVSDLFLNQTTDFLQEHQNYLTISVLSTGVPFVLYYLYSYFRLHRQGYQVSWQKVWLMIITSSVSIYCWGFRSFIDAFWVMNFFHALQYFAIVAFTEKRNLAQLFRVSRFSHAPAMAIMWVISFSFLYGLWSANFATTSWCASLAVTTSLMHFWYDGFVWSVHKKLV